MPRRLIALPIVALLLVAGCAGETGPDWSAQAVAESQAEAAFAAIDVNSNVGVGTSRIAFGLFDEDQQLVSNAEVTMRLFRLAAQPDDQPGVAEPVWEGPLTPRSLIPSSDHEHADGVLHRHEGSPTTVYVTEATLDAAGWYGVELDATVDGETTRGLKLRMWVREDTSEPAVGDPAPRSRQRTLADAPIEALDTTVPPNPALHDRTIAEALAMGRPVLIAFATPAFCQSQFCGPVIEEVVTPAWALYRDRVQFVHVEPWDIPLARRGQLVPNEVVQEWGLLSEPFIFVTDRDGVITAKFEGIVELEELTAALDAALAR